MTDDAAIERAWELVEGGEAERALEVLSRLAAPGPRGHCAAAFACVDLGRLERARELLDDAAAEGLAADDPELAWTRGHLELAAWDLDAARAAFEQLAAAERSPEVLERLSFLADLEGDAEVADELYDEARELAPGLYPAIPRLEEGEFEKLVLAAIEALPPELQAFLEESEVVVAAVPTRELVPEGHEAEVPPELLGLFVGASLLERAESAGAEPTPILYLFQRNLERSCADLDELREEIVVTLYHELGHQLGFDEEGVAELGLE